MAYGYYRAITIDHTKVPGNLTDHPFLFNSIHLDLRTVGNGGHVTSALGYDIVFSPNPDGSSRYDHEIEKYDAATGEFIAHAKIPSISSSADTVFYIVYGDSGVTTSQENITGVWDSDFRMVQHMVDETTSTILDSTSNNNDGTKKAANAPVEAAAKIGQGQDFDGIGDYVAIADADNLSFGDGTSDDPFTFSAWVYMRDATKFRILEKGADTDTSPAEYQLTFDSSDKLRIALFDDSITGPTRIDLISDTAYTALQNNWHLIGATYDGSSVGAGLSLFIDAVKIDATAVDGGSYTAMHDTVASVFLGASFLGPDSFSDGLIDEVRISSSVRSTDYITATYNNQSSPGTFYGLQAAEQLARAPRGGVTFTSMIGVV